MAEKHRPAWFGWVADRAGRYLWRPRHGRDEGSAGVSWMATLVVAAVILEIGAAAYAGFRIGDDERTPADLALPGPSLLLPGGYPSVAVSVAAAPSASAASAPPSPSVAASRPAAPPPAGRSRPAEAVTTYPPAARTKTPVWQERVIASTSVLTTGQSWSTNRLKLTVTGGGNLVLQDQGRTVWQTGTTRGVKLVMQNDGHLVLYDAGNGTAWSSGTAGNPGAVLILRADGNMVISLNGRTLFQTHTAT
jgi:hypothetical protein